MIFFLPWPLFIENHVYLQSPSDAFSEKYSRKLILGNGYVTYIHIFHLLHNAIFLYTLIIWMIGYKYVSNALYFFSITSWICHPWGWCCPDQRQKEINHQALSQSAWAFLKIDVIFAFFTVLFLILVNMQIINILLVKHDEMSLCK